VTFHYELVTVVRPGRERARPYSLEEELAPGRLIKLDGRDWLVERVEEPSPEDGQPARVVAKPARYRLVLRHPEGRVEVGALRRLRPDGPRLGHAFATFEDGQPVSWQVVDERLAWDERGDPYLELLAERDYGELEQIPDHELEHTLSGLPEEEAAPGREAIARAEEEGLAVELVALEPGEEPDWQEAERYIDALVLEEIEDDLLELCGVDPDSDPPQTWLAAVKERLRSDLERLRADIETDHDQIEEWELAGGRVFAAVGRFEDESNPHSGFGWMCRLVDSGALAAAGFVQVRKADL